MKIIHSILTALLALLVLVSSTSFTVNMHVCGGHVQSVALVQEATSCAMDLMLACQGIQEKKSNSCCEDKSVIFEGQDFSATVDHISTELYNASWIADLPFIIPVSPSSSITSFSRFILYKPPLLSHDISVLVHSFQI